jgi:hypothetical protein
MPRRFRGKPQDSVMTRQPPARRALVAALATSLLGLAGAAAAQVQRNFPPNALRGMLVVVDPPQVTINGLAAQLAPGARIRGANNMIQLSATIVGQKLLVHYTLNAQGALHEVWILTAAEAARRPWPETPREAQAWRFDAPTQTWIKP